MNSRAPDKSQKSLWASAIVVFVVLCGNELGIAVRGGEEQYLAFAKQFMDPEWIPGSFSLTEFAGTRVVFQVIVGSLLKVISIEQAVFVLRLLACSGMAYALARLFSTLRIQWYWAFVIAQLFVMSNQSFFGEEWIIKSFEPKVVAYIFVILALESLALRQLGRSAVLLACATYFHFLVGGWLVVAIGIYLLVEKVPGWTRKFALPYVVIIIPFVLYLFSGYFSSPPIQMEVDLDWVYCYYRLPHHLGIFVSSEFFIEKQLTGVVVSALVLVCAVLLKNHLRPKMQVFRKLLIIALAVTLLFVPVAWADANILDFELAGILKYYPFRLSGIALFLTILVAGDLIRTKLEGQDTGRYVAYTIMAFAVILFVAQTINHVKDEVEFRYRDSYLQAIDYIKSNTAREAVFAIVNTSLDNVEYNAFIRLSERENFSVKKFVPGEKHKLKEWYERQQALMSVNEDNQKVELLNDQYGVTHTLSPLSLPYGDLIFENEAWHIYRIE